MTATALVALDKLTIVTRVAWAVTSGLALWSAVAVHDWSWWILVFLLLPDLPLFAGGGPGLERGQLHPRAVPWYNATHHPLLAFLAVAVSWFPLQAGATMPSMVALTWVAHIALDRSLGYGLRDRTGRRRAALQSSGAPARAFPHQPEVRRAAGVHVARPSFRAAPSTAGKSRFSTASGVLDVAIVPVGPKHGGER